MNEEKDTLVLEFEDGTEEELEVVAVFEVGDKEYMALIPMEEPEDEEDVEVFFYRYVELNEDEFELEDVDDEEFEVVAKEFAEIMSH